MSGNLSSSKNCFNWLNFNLALMNLEGFLSFGKSPNRKISNLNFFK